MNADANKSRLRWQCRRGMRELDVLLTRYLDEDYGNASDADKAAFETLLTLSDPELVGYLLNRERPTRPDIDRIVTRLRD